MHLRSAIHKNPRLNSSHQNFQFHEYSHPIVRHVTERNEFEGMSGLTLFVCLLLLTSGGRAYRTSNINMAGNTATNSLPQDTCGATNSTHAFNLQSSRDPGQVSNNLYASQHYYLKNSHQSSTKNRKKKERTNKKNLNTTANKTILNDLIEAIKVELPDISAIRSQIKALASQTDISFFLGPLLKRAIQFGKIDVVRMLLDEGADPNGIAESVQPLAVAAAHNYFSIGELLVERGARASSLKEDILVDTDVENAGNILFADEGLVSLKPLHVAVLFDPGSINTLLDEGADIEAESSTGIKPVILAAKHSPKALEILLARGASVNTREPKKVETPLHVAVRWNNESIPVLIKAGANLTALNKNGLTPLHVAAVENPSAIPILLAEKIPVDPNGNRDKATPLYLACEAKNYESVVNLLKHGASPNAPSWNGRTPLHIAAKSFEKAVAILLEKGGNPNIGDDIDGSTPLDFAIDAKRIKTVKLLLQSGATYNRRKLWALNKLMSEPDYAQEIFKLLDEHEQAVASKTRQAIMYYLKTILKVVVLALVIIVPIFMIVYIVNKAKTKTKTANAKEFRKGKILEALNKLTKDFYNAEWVAIDVQTFFLKAEPIANLCIDSADIISETLKVLGPVEKVVNRDENKIVVRIKLTESVPHHLWDAEKLANGIKQYSPEKKLKDLNKTLDDSKSVIATLIDEHKKNKEDVLSKIEIVEKRKKVLESYQNVNNTDLKRKVAKLLGHCDTIIRRSETWLKLPLTNLESLHKNVDEQLKERSLQLTTKKLTYKTFAKKYEEILNLLKSLREIHKEYSEDYANNLRDIREKTEEVNQPIGLPDEGNRRIEAEEKKPAPKPEESRVEGSDVVSVSPDLPPVPLILDIPNSTEEKTVDEKPKRNVVTVLNLEQEPDDRHKKGQAVLVTAPRQAMADLPALGVSFFADNVQLKSKAKEKAKGNPMLHLETGHQEALNVSAYLEKLQKNAGLSELDDDITSSALLYHMIRFMKSLWDLFLFEKDNLKIAPAIAKLRHTLVHVAILRNPSIGFQKILIEGATRLKELLCEPYIILCKEKRKTFIPDLIALVNNFPALDIPLFNLKSERLSCNSIIEGNILTEGLVETISKIKIIGKIFTQAHQLDIELERAAAIKMRIIKIGEYCELLEGSYPTELATVSLLLPKILWNLDQIVEVVPITEVCKMLRGRICHKTKAKPDHSFTDIDGSLLFRLINLLLESDLTKTKIVEQLERKDKIVSCILRQIDDVSFRRSISVQIVEAFEDRKMSIPPNILELLHFKKKLQAQLISIKQELCTKYRMDQNTKPAALMLTLFENGQAGDATGIQEIIQSIHANDNDLITACSQRETIVRYVTAIESGLQISPDIADQLLSVNTALSMRP